MTKPDFSDPASLVTAFIQTMHYWQGLAGALGNSAQARFNASDDSTMHPEELRASEMTRQIPSIIVAIYLTDRHQASVPVWSYSIPPEYDPATETVTRVVPKTKSQVVVQTDRKALYMGGVREYVVKKQGDVWLIDSISATIDGKKRKLAL